jgi:hypothetical protein
MSADAESAVKCVRTCESKCIDTPTAAIAPPKYSYSDAFQRNGEVTYALTASAE